MPFGIQRSDHQIVSLVLKTLVGRERRSVAARISRSNCTGSSPIVIPFQYSNFARHRRLLRGAQQAIMSR